MASPPTRPPDDIAQKESRLHLSMSVASRSKFGEALGRDVTIGVVAAGYDAVFLCSVSAISTALGLTGAAALADVMGAVDYIADLRQAADQSAVGRSGARAS